MKYKVLKVVLGREEDGVDKGRHYCIIDYKHDDVEDTVLIHFDELLKK
jgi:hypothetical protein